MADSIDAKVLSYELLERHEYRDKQGKIEGFTYPKSFTLTYDKQASFEQIYKDLMEGFSKYSSRYDGKLEIHDYWGRGVGKEDGCPKISDEEKGQAATIVRYWSDMNEIDYLYAIQRKGEKVHVMLLDHWSPRSRVFDDEIRTYITAYESRTFESLKDGTLQMKVKYEQGSWKYESRGRFSLETKKKD